MTRTHAATVDFERVRSTVPLSAVLERYGFLSALKGSRKTLKGRCPIHGGSNARQFVVDLDKQLWRCFSPDCDRGGGVIELVAEVERISARDAGLMIARWFAIPTGPVSNHQREKRSTSMSSSLPTHKAFIVEDVPEGSDRKAFWHRIGSAWPFETKKSTGLNIVITPGISVSGRIVLLEFTEEDRERERQERDAREADEPKQTAKGRR